MKISFSVLACFWLGAAFAVELHPDGTEIVIAPEAPSPVRFAAKEMESFLGRVLGANVPRVDSPSKGKSSIVLGGNKWSRAAGIDPDRLPDDGFCIVASSNCIYICGKDDDNGDFSGRLKRGTYGCSGKRGTLFGVYEFMERYAGCRFFFPGEMGTIIPELDRIEVPDGKLEVSPYFSGREPYFLGDGAWIDGSGATINDPSPAKALNWLRLRLRRRPVPCCHGQNKFMYVERFAKSHPEYFQLRWDNTRCDKIFPGLHFDSGKMRQLCHSSKVYDEMFSDIVSYMRGEDASVRGIPSRWEKGKFAWGENCKAGKYIDIMPQDGYQRCWCEDCRREYAPYKGDPHFATELVWRRTAELGTRLKEAGVDCIISQMAYVPYGDVPKFDLPDNIYVVVAQGGPWSRSTPALRREQVDHFRKWSEKVHRRVGFWTYPQKLGSLKIPTVPAMAPRAWGEYYKLIAPYTDGGFCESESDRAIYHYLNYYVFSKVSWDVNTDIEKVLADHHEKMFGAGAKAMAKFYDALEEKWIYGITVNFYDSPYGPLVRAPNEYDIWKSHYSEETLKEWTGFFTEALSCVPPGSDESRRIVFIREQFLDPLLRGEARKALLERSSVEKEISRRAANPMPNLIANSDIETMDGWIVERNTKEGEMDSSTSAVGKSSLRLVSDGKAAARCYFSSELKMDTKYRVSFFVKMDSVKSKSAFGGIFAEVWDGHTWIYLPHLKDRSLFGTRDWSHVSYEFKTSQKRTEKLKPFFHFLMNDVTGTAWFDGVRIEEVTSK